MGYPIDLDEIPTDRILVELGRREQELSEGKCPYCHAPVTSHTCRYAGKEDEYHKHIFHPAFSHGRVTGRFSSTKENLSNVPKTVEDRHNIGPDGRMLNGPDAGKPAHEPLPKPDHPTVGGGWGAAID